MIPVVNSVMYPTLHGHKTHQRKMLCNVRDFISIICRLGTKKLPPIRYARKKEQTLPPPLRMLIIFLCIRKIVLELCGIGFVLTVAINLDKPFSNETSNELLTLVFIEGAV